MAPGEAIQSASEEHHTDRLSGKLSIDDYGTMCGLQGVDKVAVLGLETYSCLDLNTLWPFVDIAVCDGG